VTLSRSIEKSIYGAQASFRRKKRASTGQPNVNSPSWPLHRYGQAPTHGFVSVAKGQGLTHLCCWAYSRQNFIDAQKSQLKGKTRKADLALNLIGKLYGVERQTKEKNSA